MSAMDPDPARTPGLAPGGGAARGSTPPETAQMSGLSSSEADTALHFPLRAAQQVCALLATGAEYDEFTARFTTGFARLVGLLADAVCSWAPPAHNLRHCPATSTGCGRPTTNSPSRSATSPHRAYSTTPSTPPCSRWCVRAALRRHVFCARPLGMNTTFTTTVGCARRHRVWADYGDTGDHRVGGPGRCRDRVPSRACPAERIVQATRQRRKSAITRGVARARTPCRREPPAAPSRAGLPDRGGFRPGSERARGRRTGAGSR